MTALRTIKRLLTYTKVNVGMIIVAFLSSIIFSLASVVLPILVGQSVDMMIGVGNVDSSAILDIIIAILCVIVVIASFGWLTSMSANSLAFRTTGGLRKAVFDKINSLPLSTMYHIPDGDFIARGTSDIEFVADGLVQTFTEAISGVTTILSIIVLMFLINWVLALVVVVLTPLSMVASAVIATMCQRTFKRKSAKYGEMASYTDEIIGDINVINSFDVKDRVNDSFDSISYDLKKVGVKAHFASAMINPTTRLVNNLVYAVVGVAGALLAFLQVQFGGNGVVTPGILTTFLLYASQYTKPFNAISTVVSELQMAISSANRVFDLLDKESEAEESAKSQLVKSDQNIVFDNVSFGYTPDKMLFNGLNLKVEHGKKIAIVGKTGSGKSTLINLIMRFYEVNGGAITIGGLDTREIDRRALRDKIGMVLQETWLCSGTIRDNIAYGKPNATQEEVEEVAKRCNIHSFISRLDKGYDTEVVSGGENLSAGQRQLICIARVMLAGKDILILDEATSNIDTRTELNVQNAFVEMMEGKTTFIVAHRLSTIKSADIILVVQDGDIVEQGSFDELMAKKGHYYNLYNSQYQGKNISEK